MPRSSSSSVRGRSMQKTPLSLRTALHQRPPPVVDMQAALWPDQRVRDMFSLTVMTCERMSTAPGVLPDGVPMAVDDACHFPSYGALRQQLSDAVDCCCATACTAHFTDGAVANS